jgi:hypothetical protein
MGGEHPVEVDEALVGGRTKGEGRGNHDKTTVGGAIEVVRDGPLSKSFMKSPDGLSHEAANMSRITMC